MTRAQSLQVFDSAIEASCGQAGYREVDYSFESPLAKKAFWLGTNKPSGPFILWELSRALKKAGVVDIPRELTPRSSYRPDMLAEPLRKYLEPPVMNADDDCLRKAVHRVSQMFFVGKLRPLELTEVAFKPGKSAGAPSFKKKKDVVSESYSLARMILRGACPPPVTVFHRGKNQEVVRPVFGYPFAMSVLESMFFEPYQQALVDHHNPCVWGKSHVEIAGAINEVRLKSDAILELDYSGFDGSIHSRLLNYAFEIVRNSFSMSEKEARTFDLIKSYFITCPILLPTGKVLLGKRHGVPSGSMFTQVIDSIVSAIAVEYLRIRMDVRISRYYILGDDNIIGVVGRAPSTSAVAGILSELGLTVNPKKSRVTAVTEGQQVYFLGHFAESGSKRRPRGESWEKLLCPERVDLRFFSDSKEVRKQAMIERLMAYADDNAWIFSDALRACYFLKYGTVDVRFSFTEWIFHLNATDEERARWSPSYRLFVDRINALAKNVVLGRLIVAFY